VVVLIIYANQTGWLLAKIKLKSVRAVVSRKTAKKYLWSFILSGFIEFNYNLIIVVQMKLKIRAAQAHEARLLSQLALDSKAYWGYSADFLEACAEELTISATGMALSGFIYMLCESDSEIIGYYAIERLSRNKAELDALFVKPSHIGKGTGKKLMMHAIDQAKKMGCTTLVIQSDPHAEKFYLAMGAVVLGEQESKSVSGRYLPMMSYALDSL